MHGVEGHSDGMSDTAVSASLNPRHLFYLALAAGFVLDFTPATSIDGPRTEDDWRIIRLQDGRTAVFSSPV